MENGDDYVEVYTDSAGEKRWRFKTLDNDDILADSGEGYGNMAHLTRSLARVTRRQPTIVEHKSVHLDDSAIRVVMVDG